MMMRRNKGFTLMELIVVVAIIAVIGAIAYPNYNSYMKKSRRADAKVGLAMVVDRQERYYIANGTYTTDASDLGLGGSATWDTAEGYYKVTITSTALTAAKCCILRFRFRATASRCSATGIRWACARQGPTT